jgi:O-antigen ligase
VNSLSGDITAGVRMCVALLPLLLVPIFGFDGERMMKYLLITAVVASIYITVKLIFDPVLFIPEDYNKFSNVDLQITISSDINPNTVAQALFLLYIIIYVYLVNNRRWYLLLVELLPMLSIVLVGSRTIFVTLMSISFIMYLYASRTRMTRKIFLVILAVFLGLLVFMWGTSLNDRLILTSIMDDRGSGRFDTWQYLFNNVIPTNLMFGIGYGMTNMYDLGFDVDADNMYIDALTQMGVIGLSFIALILGSIWKRIRRNMEICSQVAVALIMFVLIAGIGETMYDTFIFVFILLYGIISVSSVNKSMLSYD